MTEPMIPTEFGKSDFAVAELIDPSRIKFFVESMADQINSFRMLYGAKNLGSTPKTCKDLSQWIVDIIIETTAQGASLLEVHIIDPAWGLLMRDENGVSFIDVDDTGYIWPPIEVNFPPKTSSAVWRLAQLRPSTDLNQANLILTFEDKIVSELREHAGSDATGIKASGSNETRAQFIQHLVKNASDHPGYPSDTPIRFKHLLPASTFDRGDLSLSQQSPVSANQKNAPPARKNPNKDPGKGKNVPGKGFVSGVEITISQAMGALTHVGHSVNSLGYLPTPPPGGYPLGTTGFRLGSSALNSGG